jgi:hypothetical protein
MTGSDFDDRSIFLNRRPNKTIVSRSILDNLTGRRLRIMSRVVDGQDGLQFAIVEGEIVLRVTPAGRYAIKATVLEDTRGIKTLTIQKYAGPTWRPSEQHFSLVGQEIKQFLEFVAGIRAITFESNQKKHISDTELREIVLDSAQASSLFAGNEDLFAELLRQKDLKRDLIAVGYRRAQLERFEKLLNDEQHFQSEMDQLGLSKPEAVWQSFFEANTWIFGYGLSFQFLTGLDSRKLEQIVLGGSINGPGKRTDALMKTRGRLSSICFVEIKRHDTPLLAAHPYRTGAWQPSSELTGAVAQLQATAQDALEAWGRQLRPQDNEEWPTGETIFNIKPRAFLVVGNLGEFISPEGINELRFRSFELYRQNTQSPEIVTFDELLDRARFIVEQAA